MTQSICARCGAVVTLEYVPKSFCLCGDCLREAAAEFDRDKAAFTHRDMRLECLKLAMSETGGLMGSAPPSADVVLTRAGRYAAFVEGREATEAEIAAEREAYEAWRAAVYPSPAPSLGS